MADRQTTKAAATATAPARLPASQSPHGHPGRRLRRGHFRQLATALSIALRFLFSIALYVATTIAVLTALTAVELVVLPISATSSASSSSSSPSPSTPTPTPSTTLHPPDAASFYALAFSLAETLASAFLGFPHGSTSIDARHKRRIWLAIVFLVVSGAAGVVAVGALARNRATVLGLFLVVRMPGLASLSFAVYPTTTPLAVRLLKCLVTATVQLVIESAIFWFCVALAQLCDYRTYAATAAGAGATAAGRYALTALLVVVSEVLRGAVIAVSAKAFTPRRGKVEGRRGRGRGRVEGTDGDGGGGGGGGGEVDATEGDLPRPPDGGWAGIDDDGGGPPPPRASKPVALGGPAAAASEPSTSSSSASSSRNTVASVTAAVLAGMQGPPHHHRHHHHRTSVGGSAGGGGGDGDFREAYFRAMTLLIGIGGSFQVIPTIVLLSAPEDLAFAIFVVLTLAVRPVRDALSMAVVMAQTHLRHRRAMRAAAATAATASATTPQHTHPQNHTTTTTTNPHAAAAAAHHAHTHHHLWPPLRAALRRRRNLHVVFHELVATQCGIWTGVLAAWLFFLPGSPTLRFAPDCAERFGPPVVVVLPGTTTVQPPPGTTTAGGAGGGGGAGGPPHPVWRGAWFALAAAVVEGAYVAHQLWIRRRRRRRWGWWWRVGAAVEGRRGRLRQRVRPEGEEGEDEGGGEDDEEDEDEEEAEAEADVSGWEWECFGGWRRWRRWWWWSGREHGRRRQRRGWRTLGWYGGGGAAAEEEEGRVSADDASKAEARSDDDGENDGYDDMNRGGDNGGNSSGSLYVPLWVMVGGGMIAVCNGCAVVANFRGLLSDLSCSVAGASWSGG
ncbi:hypothetical protein DFJ73DRAFT_935436 [Zopfochytrium polystomum]|nr:hypothetical protein DFJ73DRAFT_935436 [Zopfochytrium polystomum]